jgi:Na+-exporting ATPase
MTLLGLIGIYDPPRPESLGSVQSCQRAGIVVHMLTGDHIATATAIAKEVGIITPSTHTRTSVITAQEFDRMSDSDIDALQSLPLVVARCSPQTKVKMVKALHRRGRLTAMTGDGVNDSPSLKVADVGIAMGLAGSDVARQAAEIVLADDNFATIVGAVEEGRRIFDNLVKFMLHLMSSNAAEVIVLVVGLAFMDGTGKPVYPLSPVQILWENLITSAFPAFAYVFLLYVIDVVWVWNPRHTISWIVLPIMSSRESSTRNSQQTSSYTASSWARHPFSPLSLSFTSLAAEISAQIVIMG